MKHVPTRVIVAFSLVDWSKITLSHDAIFVLRYDIFGILEQRCIIWAEDNLWQHIKVLSRKVFTVWPLDEQIIVYEFTIALHCVVFQVSFVFFLIFLFLFVYGAPGILEDSLSRLLDAVN